MNFPRLFTLAFAAAGLASGGSAEVAAPLRAPVHPRRNVEEFAPVEARFLRFTISRTNGGSPCLDEWEVYGPDQPARNLALADMGTRVAASGTLEDYRIHALRHVNDGLYGNTHSWIADAAEGWVELELPQVERVSRIVWSRDRLGKFTDRLPTEYRIEIAREPGQWQLVASSADRQPLEVPVPAGLGFISARDRFAPWAGEPAGPAGPGARECVLETWRSAQGLPANNVTALAQTPDHWLWIGTTNGLARFDGVRFQTFGESQGLPSLRVTALAADGRGALWVAMQDGGLAWRENGSFHRLPAAAAPPDETVLALATDAGGTLWAGTSAGLYEFRGGKFHRRASGLVSRIARDWSGEGVWFINSGRLVRWAGGAEGMPKPTLDPAKFGSLGALATGADGAVWFGGANEYIARFAEGKVTTFAEGHSIFTTLLWELLVTRGGDVWMGTKGSGLARLRGGALLSFGTEDGLPSNSITALCEDDEGNVWAGGGDGLTRISPRRCAAITLNDGLSHSVVMSLAEDASGELWLGTGAGGLNRSRDGRAEPFSPSYVLDNETISALLAARDGVLWAGTARSGLARLEAGKITFLTTAHGLPENAVTALCEDADSGLWIGSPTRGAAYFFAGEIATPPALAALAGERITAIVCDPDQRVWFGTGVHGIARLDGGHLTRWTVAEGLAGNAVRTLREDAAGTLWAGTGAGLSRWRDGRFESFTARQGLPDEVVSQILDDAAGHLWLGTNRGIHRVLHRSFEDVSAGRAGRLEVLSLDKGDGLPSLECTGGFHPSGLRLRDGRLGFGTVAGLAIVDPARFTNPPAAPPVIIEEMAVGNHPPTPPDAVTAPFADNARSAKFRFTALSYTAPQRVRFRYRLEGLQTGWTAAGPERTAAYEFLPPGSFRFRVQASREGSAWSEASVAFRIPAPWWRTPWAVGAAILAGGGAVAGAVRFITRRRLKRHLRIVEEKLALERERSRIARDIHDQLGANLTHIALLSAGGQDCSPGALRERFTAIAASSNELVQAVDAIVWAVNPRHGNLESLARYLTRFAEDFLAPAAPRLRLDVPVELPPTPLSPELRHNLFLATREALNNCVRHAAATEVRLRLGVETGVLTIVVEDDGRGFSAAPGDDGDGLGNMRRRLAESGGACEISSAPGRGTTVTFTLPLPA